MDAEPQPSEREQLVAEQLKAIEELNPVTQAIERERTLKAQGIESATPTVEEWTGEIAEAIRRSNIRLSKMTHAEKIAELRFNANSPILP